MGDDNTDAPGDAGNPTATSSEGRRSIERRQAQKPFDGPDRRKGDRRSGTDRRTTPRVEGLESSDD